METQNQTGPMYEFVAAYHYGPDERYSSGHGLSALSRNLSELENTFRVFERRGETYALEIRNLTSGEVVRSRGDMEAARRSMHAAHRRSQKVA